MLGITVPALDMWDEATNQFVLFRSEDLLLEHSLVSLSKWESFTEKPFLVKEPKSREETVEYITMMNIAPVNQPDVFKRISDENMQKISDYIDLKMTATWFNDSAPSRPSGEITTAEIIYYWMVTLQVPMECQYWHLNKLLTLIRVINLKNAPAEKRGRQQTAQQRRDLNAQRRAASGTSG